MTTKKIVLHTDILIAHLTCASHEVSIMRRAMRTYFCYTTVFNAIELFSLISTNEEREIVEHVMSSIKILGLNAKGAPKYGELIAKKELPRMNSLIAGLCMESKLPILTGKPNEFRKVKGLVIVTPKQLETIER